MVESCRVCGGAIERWLTMAVDPIKNEPSPHANSVRCSACGTGHIDPLPDGSEIAGFYDLATYYTHGQSHIPAVAARIVDRVVTKAAYLTDHATPFRAEDVARELPPGGRIVDLGCGGAELLGRFRGLGFEVVGVDPDPNAIAHAARLGVEVPNCACIHFQMLGAASAMYDAPRHLWFFEPDGLKAAVEAAGFAFSRWHFDGFVRHYNADWRGWEQMIDARARTVDPQASTRRHSLARSATMLAREAFAAPARKYDCVGILATASA